VPADKRSWNPLQWWTAPLMMTTGMMRPLIEHHHVGWTGCQRAAASKWLVRRPSRRLWLQRQEPLTARMAPVRSTAVVADVALFS